MAWICIVVCDAPPRWKCISSRMGLVLGIILKGKLLKGVFILITAYHSVPPPMVPDNAQSKALSPYDSDESSNGSSMNLSGGGGRALSAILLSHFCLEVLM